MWNCIVPLRVARHYKAHQYLHQQKNLPPQQLILPTGRYRVAASSAPDYECPIAEACVDVTTEHGDVNDLEQSVAEDIILQHNQNDDPNYRVLTVLQPYIEDESYAAMLEENGCCYWSQDMWT